jgi:excinuclease ABC subunit B
VKAVTDIMEGARADSERGGRRGKALDDVGAFLGPEQAMKKIRKLEAEMYKHARNLEFEEAARIRDEIERLRKQAFGAPGSMAG